MPFDDSLLLYGSEPEPWDEESAPFGLCDGCESALEVDGCPVCAPRCPLENTPLRASFTIAPPVNRGTPGVVTWAGWSSP